MHSGTERAIVRIHLAEGFTHSGDSTRCVPPFHSSRPSATVTGRPRHPQRHSGLDTMLFCVSSGWVEETSQCYSLTV